MKINEEKVGKSFCLKEVTFPPKPGFAEIYLKCSVSSSEKRFGRGFRTEA
jgi:hypothetical protein